VAGVAETLAHARQQQQASNFNQAEQLYRQVLQADPGLADGWRGLGAVLVLQDKLNEAVAALQQALSLQPNSPEAHNTLGCALQSQNRLEEALACFHRAISLNSNFAEACFNLGSAYYFRGPSEDTVYWYRQAVRLNPNNFLAHCNLGFALAELGNPAEAVGCFRQALMLNPNFADGHLCLAQCLDDLEQHDEAEGCYKKAMQLEPSNPAILGHFVFFLQRQCIWENLAALSRRVIETVVIRTLGGKLVAVDPFVVLTLPMATTPQQQYGAADCARRWAERRLQKTSKVRCLMPDVNNLDSLTPDIGHRTSDKLTVGYLSANFGADPFAYSIHGFIEKHDRTRFEILGYSYGPDDGSAIRRRVSNAFDRFVDLKDASYQSAAQRIHEDKVDILVDLTGYQRGARPHILALRPSPIQVSYLGYPGTMAAPFIDYILVDEIVVPADQQPFFAEKLVHLKGCYYVPGSQDDVAVRTPSRQECGLPEVGFVFCCFNGCIQITPDMFDVWMNLLKSTPGSVLWLIENNPRARANLINEAQVRGAATERLIFATHLARADHLARYCLADLCLDSFPFSGIVTAADALRAGCPVLTMAGQSFASRLAGSMLRMIGLPELITTSFHQYHEVGVRLAQDANLLAGLRMSLRANRQSSELFDAGQFARKLEKAYFNIWENYASGKSPRAFAVP
jgi:protein O-GlcNAc transferase